MKRIALLMLSMISCYFSFSQAQETEEVLLPKANNRNINFGKQNRDRSNLINTNTSNLFTDWITNQCTSVKNQQNTGTCWSFSTTSLLESQYKKSMLEDIDVSEMFTVRNIYIEKAKNYFLRQGHAQFGEGGLGHDVINAVSKYGAMPEIAYSGLPQNVKSYNHQALVVSLKKYLDSTIASNIENQKSKKINNTNWLLGYNQILDQYLGVAPTKFVYQNQSYTPQSFAKTILHFNGDEYVNITSFTHHPFYEPFILEVPDNFSNGSYYNLPLNEMIELVKSVLQQGYTLLWDTDVSNIGFNHQAGFAMNLEDNGEVKPSLMNPDSPEGKWNDKIRQDRFENLTTQDDHLMHIVGVEKAKNGKIFFIVKNSYGPTNPFKGFVNVSEAYFAINTVSLVVPKAAINKILLEKLKISK